MNTLVTHIRKYIDFSNDDVNELGKHATLLNLQRKDFLIQEEQVCNSFFFVRQGALRMYYITEKASEQIVQFAIEGWWISDYFSFMDNTPSKYCIQAIEKSEVIAITKTDLDLLLAKLPHLERYFRIVMQRDLAASQYRNKLLYEMSKEEFYRHFSTTYPQFVQRVPQYMIASYLGLTPEYVSELRKKK